MSIHKSKGLEFPIVIVSGMGKNFNKQDTRSKMVLHPELSIGLDYMDGKSVSNHRLSQRRRLQSRSIWKISRGTSCAIRCLNPCKRKAHSHRDIKGCPGKTRIFQATGESFESKETDRFPTLQEKGFRLSGLDTSGSAFLWGQIPGPGSWKRQSLS